MELWWVALQVESDGYGIVGLLLLAVPEAIYTALALETEYILASLLHTHVLYLQHLCVPLRTVCATSTISALITSASEVTKCPISLENSLVRSLQPASHLVVCH